MQKNWLQSFIRLVRKDMASYQENDMKKQEMYRMVAINMHRKKEKTRKGPKL